LLALLVLWVIKWLLPLANSLHTKSHFFNYKSNANTTDLCTKLLKTVTENVLKSNYNRNVSDGMENVVKDSGDGRCFLELGDAMGATKNVVLEPLASASAGAAVLHK